MPTRPRCTIKVDKQPLLPIGPTRPWTLTFSLSQGTLFHIFLSSLYKEKIQTGWCDPLVLNTTPKGYVLVTSSRGGQYLEKKPSNNRLGERTSHIIIMVYVTRVLWAGTKQFPGHNVQEDLAGWDKDFLVWDHEDYWSRTQAVPAGAFLVS